MIQKNENLPISIEKFKYTRSLSKKITNMKQQKYKLKIWVK